MKNLRKLITLSACGLALFVLSGCGALTPKDMEGAYQNDKITYYLYHKGTTELPNKDKLEEFDVYKTTPESNYKGKQYYDSAPKIIVDKEQNICDIGLIGNKIILGKIEKDKLTLNKDVMGFSASLSKGEYKKTNEKLPTDEALKYTSNEAKRDKRKDEHPEDYKPTTTLSSKFDSLVDETKWR